MVSPPGALTNPAARAFLRSLNILLKYSRLYGTEHLRTVTQFNGTWSELDAALRSSGETGVLVGLAGSDLLLDGVPVGAGSAEKSLAQLLSSAGVASIHFTTKASVADLKKLQGALVQSGKKPNELAQNLKAAFKNSQTVKLNQLRFVAQSEGLAAPAIATQLTAAALSGADASQVQDWLNDPHKLLQAIAAVEGNRQTGMTAAPATGTFSSPVTGTFPVPGRATNAGFASPLSGETVAGLEEQELTLAFRMLAQWSGSTIGTDSAAEDVSNLKLDAQRALRNALLSLSDHPEADRPMLLQLAEHLAIRFALDRFERGDVEVNAVREMLDRMARQMENLRKVLSTQEERMAKAGLTLESHAEILDRQFWAAVPEKGKLSVLLSEDAWCIPAHNVRSFVEELRTRGEQQAQQVLAQYAACIRSKDPDARKKIAAGLSEIADAYGSAPAQLEQAIATTCAQLAEEKDPEMQKLLGAAFVRLSQEAASRRNFAAVQQSLNSLQTLESQMPELAAQLRPRIGVHDRLPEFVQEAISTATPSGDLLEMLRTLPQAAIERLVSHFEACVRRDECERIVALAGQLGPAAIQHLRDRFKGTQAEAVLTVGLLSRLDSTLLERELHKRLHQWQRAAQDVALRQLSSAAAPDRGRLLVKALDFCDSVLLPQVIDEIGLTGDRQLTGRLMSLAFDGALGENSEFLRVKAIEALGRIRELKAEAHLRQLVEAREFLHWKHPRELRVAAAQALLMLDPGATRPFLAHKAISQQELALGPLPAIEQCKWARQRRYARMAQTSEVTARLLNAPKDSRLQIEQLGMGGGLASAEGSFTSGAAADLDLRAGLQRIHARVWLKEERPQKFSFEILGINLDDRTRLRYLLSGERLNIPAALFDRQISAALPLALR